jgi:tRNA G18 (ribose-2'-O)-methylase SpoU
MPVIHIDGPGDRRIADFHVVSDPELVGRRGLFVAEGRLVVERLIAAGRFRLRSLLLSEAALRALGAVVSAIEDVPIYVARPEEFLGVTGYDLHRGCLALVERPQASRVADLVKAARTVVVLEGVANADNVGGVFRNALAFRADAVLLSPTSCDPLYRKAIRTSMAATLRVPFARVEPWPGALSILRDHGFATVALTLRQPSEDLDQFALLPPPRLALLAGTEGAGLSAAVEEAADHRVRIAISPDVDSLNLAVAVGIALHRLRR